MLGKKITLCQIHIWNQSHVIIDLIQSFDFYLHLFLATTLQDVRLELAKEDSVLATQLAAQGDISGHKTSLTSFLTTGLELEEQKYV